MIPHGAEENQLTGLIEVLPPGAGSGVSQGDAADLRLVTEHAQMGRHRTMLLGRQGLRRQRSLHRVPACRDASDRRRTSGR